MTKNLDLLMSDTVTFWFSLTHRKQHGALIQSKHCTIQLYLFFYFMHKIDISSILLG